MSSTGEAKADRYPEYAEDYRKAGNWTVLFAAALAVVHLLNITPSEVDALGTKIVLKEPIILRGALAILFLHHFHSYVFLARVEAAYRTSNEVGRQIARATLRRHRKQKRKLKTAKLMARVDLGMWMWAYAPYTIALLGLLVAALILSLMDVIHLAEYCYEHTPAGQYVQAFLNGDV